MTSVPRVLHRLCATCDRDVSETVTHCPTCGSKLVEIRDEVDEAIGTVIDGRFEIRDRLGQGGMGTVYRAWQRSVGREVAVKLIDRSFSRDPMGVRRFLREARLASQLSQPNTVSVFDFGQAEDGRLFIAMELIRGRTLQAVVETDGAFSVERTVRIGVQICDALDAAHALGIVHRDLKLENVIVLDHPPGRDLLKVLDFGLAKNFRDPGSHATESGIVVGTPRYMAPEAATAGIAVPAGDVYGVGVILGELSSGKPLWSGESLPLLVAQKLDPDKAVARCPTPLRPVLSKLLHPEPDYRPTAAQARAMLGAIGNELGASDTIRDATESDPRETTNLRARTPVKPRTPAVSDPVVSSSPAASAAASLSPSMLEVTRPPVKRYAALVVAVAAAAAVVAAVVIFVMSRREGAPAAAVPHDAAVLAVPLADAAANVEIDAAVALEPTHVEVRIVSVPAGASVTYRGKTHRTPFTLEIERGEQPIVIQARLAGRATKKVSFVPDRDQTVEVALPRPVAGR